MTIILGMKCSDGVVVASDSYAELRNKRLKVDKIYTHEGRYIFAGAGI